MTNDELPEWGKARLEELTVKVGSGSTPRGGETNYKKAGVPLIRSMNVVFFGFKRDGLAHLDDDQAAALNSSTVRAGDVLLNITGASIGRVTMTPADMDGARVNQHVCIIRPSPAIEGRFLNAFLSSPTMQQQIFGENYGVTRQALTKQQILDFEIPLPPLAEQKRIADKLEAVLGRVDACRARLDRVPDLLKRFRQSVLAAATSGQLTENWRKPSGDEYSVDKLLAQANLLRQQEVQMANARQSLTRFKYKPAALIDLGNQTRGIDELFSLPPTWAWASVGQLTWAVADGPHFSPKYVQKEDGVPFISGRNISYHGIDFSDAKYISHSDHAEFQKRAKPEIGDVLLTKGGTTGIATVVSTSEDFSIWVHVALLKPVASLVDPRYLRDVLSAPYAYAQSQALTHGVGNQDLGLTRMVHIAVPLPPLPEQAEIVRRVEALFAMADWIEARVKAARARVERLTPASLSKAFRGDLVPQDPNDEPASALLERVRAQANDPMPKLSPKPRMQKAPRAEADPPRKPAPVVPLQSELLLTALVQETPASYTATPPKPIPQPAPASHERGTSIDDLDKNDLMAVLRETLEAHGPCDRDTCIRQAAYHLGYQRAGTKVAQAMDNAIRTARRRGVVLPEDGDDLLHLNRASIAEMEADDRSFLKDQFLAALSQQGKVWIERDESARLLARWLGLRRTSAQAQDIVRSLINGLLREQRLEAEGSCIRRI